MGGGSGKSLLLRLISYRKLFRKGAQKSASVPEALLGTIGNSLGRKFGVCAPLPPCAPLAAGQEPFPVRNTWPGRECSRVGRLLSWTGTNTSKQAIASIHKRVSPSVIAGTQGTQGSCSAISSPFPFATEERSVSKKNRRRWHQRGISSSFASAHLSVAQVSALGPEMTGYKLWMQH